jgi:hypothetical protein
MQLTFGRRWVLEFQFSFAIRKSVDGACSTVRHCLNRSVAQHDRKLRWERDKLAGMMLSGWDETSR